MFNRLLSMLGLVRPDPKRMPAPFGALKIRPRLGVKARKYFKSLRKVMPYLTKEDEKVLRAYYKSLAPGDVGWIMVLVSKKSYLKKYDPSNSLITVSQGQSINCNCRTNDGGRFYKGCCGGPHVGSKKGLEKSYYIKEYLGEASWPMPLEKSTASPCYDEVY